jgi:nucleoside 2-deoxyribosyltransferase
MIISRLRGSKVYLCGAMDRVIDGGVIWRQNITPMLENMGVIVLDPVDKPIDIDIADENIDNRKLRHELKQNKNFKQVSKYMKIIRQVDLRMVDIADFLIVSLDIDVHACGTYEELFWANRQKKPILVWVPQGKENAPDWLFGTIPHQMIFSSVKGIRKYLSHINSSTKVNTMGRWVFFNYNQLYIDRIEP